jgi:hypothetical protein
MSALGHSRPSHFVPVLNNVRYASDSDHSRYESELTLWATSGLMHCNNQYQAMLVSTLLYSILLLPEKPDEANVSPAIKTKRPARLPQPVP